MSQREREMKEMKSNQRNMRGENDFERKKKYRSR